MTTPVSVLPFEIINHIISFRQVHPVAKLMRDFKEKFTYCIVCLEEKRCEGLDCCSSTCMHQLNDALYFNDDPYFKGYCFGKLMCAEVSANF